MELLKVRESHVKEKAQLISSNNNNNNNNNNGDGANSSNRTNNNSQSNNGNNSSADYALRALEEMRSEQQRQLESFSVERKTLQSEYSQRFATQEKKHKSELAEIRIEKVTLEDQISMLQEALDLARKEISHSEQMCAQLDTQRIAAIETQQRLRADLKNMQQAVQGSYRMDSTSNNNNNNNNNNNVSASALSSVHTNGTSHGTSNGTSHSTINHGVMSTPLTQLLQKSQSSLPADMETALRLHDATYESKMKQLTNKLDFLKQQLETERRAVEDGKNAVAELQQHIDHLQSEQLRKLSEQDKLSMRRLAEQEESLRSEYEVRMIELTSLQRLVQSLQSQSQALTAENVSMRERERQFQEMTQRTQQQLFTLKTENTQLTEQLRLLEHQRESDLRKDNSSNTSSKLNQEAVLRRLDNEKHYLKNQLTAEITLKNELQRALTQCQEQLIETQQTWQRDVSVLQETQRSLQETLQRERDDNVATKTRQQTDLDHLQQVNISLKEAVIKLRDTIRMDEVRCENLETEKNSLLEAVKQRDEDLQRNQQNVIQQRKQFDQQLQVTQQLLEEQQQRQTEEVKRLKDELAKQFLENSQLQLQVLKHKEQLDKDQQLLQRQHEVRRLFFMLNKWQMNKLQRGFQRWHVNTTLQVVASQFKQSLDKILKQVKNDMQQLQKEQCDQLQREHEIELQNEKENWQKDAFEEQQRFLETKQIQWEEEKKDLQDDWQQQLKQCEEDFEFDKENWRKEREKERFEYEQFYREKQEELKQEHAKQLALKEVAWKEQTAESLQALATEKEVEFTAKSEQLRQHCNATLLKMRNQFEVDLDFQLTNLKNEHETRLQALDILKVDELKKQEESLKKAFLDEKTALQLEQQQETENFIIQMRSKEERALSAQRNRLHEEFEDRLRLLREEWEEDQLSQRKQLDDAWKVRWQAEEERLTSTFQIEKETLIKQHERQYERKLEEFDRKFIDDLEKAKVILVEEMEKKFDVERKRLQETFDLQVIKEQEKHKIALEERNLEFEKMKETFVEEEMKIAQERMSEFVRTKEAELSAFFEEKFSVEFEIKEKDLLQQLKVEKDNFTKLKTDFVQRNNFFANERANLMMQVTSAESRIESVEATKRVEIAQMLRDFEAEKELIHVKFEAKIAEVQEKTENDKKQLQEQLKEKYLEEADLRLARERDRLTREFDEQIHQLQEESEKMVNQLEAALHKLKEEKLALHSECEKLQGKLEDTEDTLFDLQRTFQLKTKEHSLLTWQMICKFLKLKQRFMSILQENDAQHIEQIEKTKQEASYQFYDLAHQFYKVSFYVHETEQKRKQLLEIIQSFKPQELKRLKKKIQVLESEIEILSNEKESFESSRQILVDEIEQMTEEVKEQELLIKELQSESAVTVNGRINVAFARKKRRIDQEIERLLESIELKRENIADLDERIIGKTRQREEKESEMIDIERQLVAILIEQQRLVLKEITELGGYAEKAQFLFSVLKLFAWPPSLGAEPSMQEVRDLIEITRAEEERRKIGYVPSKQAAAQQSSSQQRQSNSRGNNKKQRSSKQLLNSSPSPNEKQQRRNDFSSSPER
jgi:hypothetical protein